MSRPVNVLWVIDHVCYDGSLHGGGRLFWNVLPCFDPDRVRVIPYLLRATETIRKLFEDSPVPVRILDKAKFDPTIDGEVEWKPIEETSLAYVANSPTPIIRVAPNAYYAVVNGVWFSAAALTDTWAVATEVPNEIYAIPTSSPLHYVTYVRIYDSDEETVVVGYTPGYYGTVVSNEVVVYGTGYYHYPWVGSYWYGYPATWGYACGITYTPWGGWSFSFGIGWGWGYWGGWYAPYYPPY